MILLVQTVWPLPIHMDIHSLKVQKDEWNFRTSWFAYFKKKNWFLAVEIQSREQNGRTNNYVIDNNNSG